MFELDRSLAEKLDNMNVEIDVQDDNTIVFRGVPAKDSFNKECTNLLIKKLGRGRPLLVCVDEDLEYTGRDPSLARAFAGEAKREGWRVLHLDPTSQRDFQSALCTALSALGLEAAESALHEISVNQEETKSLLAIYGKDLTELARKKKGESIIGRQEEADEVVACVLRWGQVRLALILGESGVGKTNLLQAVANKLLQCRPDLRFLSLDLADPMSGTLFGSEQESRLMALLEEAAQDPNILLGLENFELALSIRHGPLLLAKFLDTRHSLVGTAVPNRLQGFLDSQLARRTHTVSLAELSQEQTLAVLNSLREQIAAHHGIEIVESCTHNCIKAAHPLPGFFPAKALALIDAAAARATLAGSKILGPDDIFAAAACFPGLPSWER